MIAINHAAIGKSRGIKPPDRNFKYGNNRPASSQLRRRMEQLKTLLMSPGLLVAVEIAPFADPLHGPSSALRIHFYNNLICTQQAHRIFDDAVSCMS